MLFHFKAHKLNRHAVQSEIRDREHKKSWFGKWKMKTWCEKWFSIRIKWHIQWELRNIWEFEWIIQLFHNHITLNLDTFFIDFFSSHRWIRALLSLSFTGWYLGLLLRFGTCLRTWLLNLKLHSKWNENRNKNEFNNECVNGQQLRDKDRFRRL